MSAPLPTPTRRQLLVGGGGPTVPGSPQAPRGPAPRATGSEEARELFLAHHATQGFSPQVLDEIRSFPGGSQAWVENQLGLAGTIDDSEVEGLLATPHWEDLFRSAHELFHIYRGPVPYKPLTDLIEVLQAAKILRALRSRRQLHERLVEFWSDHLHVWIRADAAVTIFKPVEDREVIRPNALGRFGDLLEASAKSAAMLRYLSGDLNTAAAPNENYSRELFELHTLGSAELFGEEDVLGAAQLFTGWSYIMDTEDPNLGAFEFRPADHSTGSPIQVLGVDYSSGGQADGEQLLADLAGRPETAEFLCSKLVLWLLGHPLPPSLQQLVVDEYLDTGGDIALTVRQILSEPMLDAAIAAGGAFKRPSRLVDGLLRQLEVDPGPDGSGVHAILGSLTRMGQLPHDWPLPSGCPTTREAWGGDLFGRWAFIDELLHDRLAPQGCSVPHTVIDELLTAGTPLDIRDAIEQRLTGAPFEESERAQLLEHLTQLLTQSPSGPLMPLGELLREALAFAASLPGYQFD